MFVDGSRFSQHVACNKCRAEKLRCSGERGGCSRCKSSRATCVYSKHGRDERAKRQRQRSPEQDPDISANPVNQGRRRNALASPSRGQQPSQLLQSGNQAKSRSLATQTRSAHEQHHDQQQYVTSRSDASLNTHSFMSDLDRVHFPPSDTCSLDDVLDNTDAIDLDFSRRNGTVNSTAFSSLFQDVNLPIDGENDNAADQGSRMLPDFSSSPILSISPTPQRPSINLPRQIWSHQHNSSSGTASSSTGSPFQAFRAGYDDSSYSTQGLVSPASFNSLFTPRPPAPHHPYPQSGERGLTGSNSPLQPATVESCHCLDDIPLLLSDLEFQRSDGGTSASSTTLDSSLSYHREILTRVSQLLSCPNCRSKSEFLVLLSVVCEKSTALWETMLLERPSFHSGGSGAEAAAAAAATSPQSPRPSLFLPLTSSSSSSSSRPNSNGHNTNSRTSSISSNELDTNNNNNKNNNNNGTKKIYNTTTTAAAAIAKKAFLGDYEVHSIEEWQLLMAVLLNGQLCWLYRLLKTIKALMVPLRNGEHIDALLTTTERRVKKLVERVGVRGKIDGS
ncbi:MAG: hypothetical protein Q9184_005803 [Pyrenodesmia sp. 2 TL-2023]